MSNKGANNEAIVAITTVDHLLRYTLKGARSAPFLIQSYTVSRASVAIMAANTARRSARGSA